MSTRTTPSSLSAARFSRWARPDLLIPYIFRIATASCFPSDIALPCLQRREPIEPGVFSATNCDIMNQVGRPLSRELKGNGILLWQKSYRRSQRLEGCLHIPFQKETPFGA